MDPERIVYAGTASKTLAPAMRLGWLAVPPRLLDAVQREQRQVDFGVSRIEQHAFADFLSRGELDRHLRRMRAVYRRRRDVLVAVLARALPELAIEGIPAGLHVSGRLPDGVPVGPLLQRAWDGGVGLFGFEHGGVGRVMLGYANLPEPSIDPAVRTLAALLRGEDPPGR
jgi:GntR family transcriptional regulator/MocR family aminotransferase